MARLDFLRFHRNRFVSNGSDGLHRTTFQPSSKYCLHFRFHLMTKLPVTQVDSTVLPVSFFDLDSIGLQVLSTGIWSRVLDMCGATHYCLNLFNTCFIILPHCYLTTSTPALNIITELRVASSICKSLLVKRYVSKGTAGMKNNM